MKRSHINITTQLVIVAMASMVASGCSDKSTTTQVNPDGSSTTTTTEKKPWGTNSVTTTTPSPTPTEYPDDTKVNVDIGRDSATGNDDVHVRGPGVKIDSNGAGDKVDINVPFVKVKRDGSGKVKVRAPFVNIDAQED